jgi:hypothetical protein
MRLARLIVLTVLLCAAPVRAVSPHLDELGNYITTDPRVDPHQASAPGEGCGTCKDPDPLVWGVEFRNGEMWLLSVRKMLFRLSGCRLVSAIPLVSTVLPAGLGYDSHRDLFIVTDASRNVVFRVTPSGRILGQWPTPGPGPVGAAYDSRRDLYWISDWEVDRLYTIDPNTGLPGPSMAVPGGSRISGTAYDPDLDALIYHSRDEALTYWISVETGSILAVYDIPQRGRNNGQDAAIDPSGGNLWLTHSEAPTAFCQQGLAAEGEEPGAGANPPRREPVDVEEPVSGPVLQGAFPNPFNPVTHIRYSLPAAGFVTLSVFDVRGRLVEVLLKETRPVGDHATEWRAEGVPSGVYFCTLTWRESSTTQRLILLK